MAVARSEASLAANPADVHRATDAVLMALDRNAETHPHILTVATSNFTTALDDAFRSRADLVLEVPRPNADAAEEILRTTLRDFGESFPDLKTLADSKDIRKVAGQVDGLDGRQIRKLVTEAMASRRETVRDPAQLTIVDLAGAAKRARGRELTRARKQKEGDEAA